MSQDIIFRIDSHAVPVPKPGRKGRIMLNAAVLFLIIALVAAVLGFGGIAGTAAGIAKILFFVFLVLALISFLSGRRTPI